MIQSTHDSVLFNEAMRLIVLSVALSNYAIGLFCALWLFFLCGGWWFSYWIKLPMAQAVHLIWLGLGILLAIMMNM
ncbi:MAG: hypothetical protein GY782_11960 [Gammaproteobacteria bacterium]|nr:hypothetical protein [Gammaproteobacteria bacterium]